MSEDERTPRTKLPRLRDQIRVVVRKRRKTRVYRALARRGKRFPWVRRGKKHLVYRSNGVDTEFCSGGHITETTIDIDAIVCFYDALGHVTCRECIEAFGGMYR